MKSPMITLNPALTPLDLSHPAAVRGDYSELRVLQSAAGFYVGTEYEEFDAQGTLVWKEPGSRDSLGYWNTAAEAARELAQMEGGDLSETRYHP